MAVAQADETAASEHFAEVDRRLFARLYSGSLEPLIIVLKDGRKLVGEAKGIFRGASAQSGAPPRGAILLVTERGEIEIDYRNVTDIR
jgi:hypothetical protein